MGKVILIEEDELKRILREVLDERKPASIATKKSVGNGDMVTSISQIAAIFKCSLPTAQKIKNSIPKELYRQIGKTFAISRDTLLGFEHSLLNNS